jgi:hypothetical protein
MKLTLSTMIEKAECRITALLNLCYDESRADCVDRPGGDENAVALRHRMPHNKIRDRSVPAGLAQLPRRETLFQAQGDPGFRCSAQDVPSFGFASLQADRPCVCIVRMNLNGKWLAGEQQLEQ